jgi:Acetyltransferases, including N-acetylases of ribosomal proteins
MNTVKKIEFKNLPQDFSPHTLPEILKLVKKIKGDTALIYERLNKPFFMETDRLIIRRFTTEDTEAIYELANDRMRSSMKNYDHQWPTEVEGCKNTAAYFAGEDIYYAVCLKPYMKLIGFIAYNSVNDNGILDLGHVWHTAYQNNSLDTEALSLMTQYAFEKLSVSGVCARNPLDCEGQIAPLKSIGMEIINTSKASFVNDENGNPIEFTACGMLITKENWETNNPESYSPKNRPEILNMIENVNQYETLVEKVNDFCSIVDRTKINIIGISVPVNFESQGYPNTLSFASGTMNDYFIAKKYIADGTIAFLAETLGLILNETEIISARYDINGDGNYNVIIGFLTEALDTLPEFLPEHTVTFTLPACRYAKIDINEQKRENRIGYNERMHADEYFIGGFRKDTAYVYNIAGYPMNTWDETGDLLTKYEPIRKPANRNDRFDTFVLTPVLLPSWKIACCSRPHGDDEYKCIFDYFDVATEVYKTGLTRYNQNGDFYGFPIDCEGSYKSCFGSRVSSFDGLPDTVEKVILPGGQYVHIIQKEFNGDNPSMSYDVAFNHMDRLYFPEHTEYEFDTSRKVIARFRQANCASVFVPVRQK